MTSLNPGIYGATRQSWHHGRPRDVLKRIMQGRPYRSYEDEVACLKLFREEIRREEHEDDLEAIIEWWFTNNYKALLISDGQVDIRRGKARRAEKVTKAKELLVERIQTTAKAILLDLVLPHGKTLRDSTGRECKRLGPKMGAWLSAIGGKVGANQTVGSALSEEEVAKLWSAARGR